MDFEGLPFNDSTKALLEEKLKNYTMTHGELVCFMRGALCMRYLLDMYAGPWKSELYTVGNIPDRDMETIYAIYQKRPIACKNLFAHYGFCDNLFDILSDGHEFEEDAYFLNDPDAFIKGVAFHAMSAEEKSGWKNEASIIAYGDDALLRNKAMATLGAILQITPPPSATLVSGFSFKNASFPRIKQSLEKHWGVRQFIRIRCVGIMLFMMEKKVCFDNDANERLFVQNADDREQVEMFALQVMDARSITIENYRRRMNLKLPQLFKGDGGKKIVELAITKELDDEVARYSKKMKVKYPLYTPDKEAIIMLQSPVLFAHRVGDKLLNFMRGVLTMRYAMECCFGLDGKNALNENVARLQDIYMRGIPASKDLFIHYKFLRAEEDYGDALKYRAYAAFRGDLGWYFEGLKFREKELKANVKTWEKLLVILAYGGNLAECNKSMNRLMEALRGKPLNENIVKDLSRIVFDPEDVLIFKSMWWHTEERAFRLYYFMKLLFLNSYFDSEARMAGIKHAEETKDIDEFVRLSLFLARAARPAAAAPIEKIVKEIEDLVLPAQEEEQSEAIASLPSSNTEAASSSSTETPNPKRRQVTTVQSDVVDISMSDDETPKQSQSDVVDISMSDDETALKSRSDVVDEMLEVAAPPQSIKLNKQAFKDMLDDMLPDKTSQKCHYFFMYGLLTMRRAIEHYVVCCGGWANTDAVIEKIKTMRKKGYVTSHDVFNEYFHKFKHDFLSQDLAFTLPKNEQWYQLYMEGINYQANGNARTDIKMQLFDFVFKDVWSEHKAKKIMKEAQPEGSQGVPEIHRILRHKILDAGEDPPVGYEGNRRFLMKRQFEFCFEFNS
jgi:hypothetical protein